MSTRAPDTATLHAPPESPYKGLAAFDDSELDEQLFFGRDNERNVIAANVIASRLTVLYGPSGVGKSSVVRAGVARDLRGLPDEPLVVLCDSWSGPPAAALTEAVALASATDARSLPDTIEIAAAEHGEIYLLLDQVEEYFIYHGSDPALGDALADLVTRPELPVHILLAIREDALARLDAFKRRLPALLANRLQLDRLSIDAGREAILGPAERFAVLVPGEPTLTVETGLVDAVLAGVSTGALIANQRGRGSAGTTDGHTRIETPYLQVVMQRVWEVERASGSNVLRRETLERLGGPASIVGEHLERALATLTPAQQALAAQVFNHLVTPSGTKIAHGTRDLVRWVGAPQAELELVLGALARGRILRPVHGAEPEPAYEIFHDVLADAILAWRTQFEAEAAVAREREAARRRHRRLLVIFVLTALALAIMGGITLYALSQRDQAQRSEVVAQASLHQAETASATARRQTAIATQALKNEQIQAARARFLARKATKEAAKARRATSRAKAAAHTASRATARAIIAARAAKTEADKATSEASRADAATAAEQKSKQQADAQATAATNAEHAAEQAEATATQQKQVAQQETVLATQAATAATNAKSAVQATEKVEASQAAAYEAQTKLPSAPEASLQLAVKAETLDPGLPLVESTLRSSLLAAREQRVLRAGDAQTSSASYSPDGTQILTAGTAGARVYRSDSGELVGTLATGRPVDGTEFSHDGSTIVTAEKGQAELWNADTRTKRKALFQEGASTHATFSGDGLRLLTSGAKSARVWNTATGDPLSRRLTFPDNVTAAAISPDGSRFAVAEGSTVSVYESAGSTEVFTLPAPSPVKGLSFSPGGDTIASAGADGVARLSNAQDGSARCATRPSDGDLTSLVFSHDGASLLTLDVQGDTRIWSTSTCAEETQLVGQLSKVVGAAFSPDDQYVATAGADRTARIYSLPDGTPQAILLGHAEALQSVAFALRNEARDRGLRRNGTCLGRARRPSRTAIGPMPAGGAVAISPDAAPSRASAATATCVSGTSPLARPNRRSRSGGARRCRVQRRRQDRRRGRFGRDDASLEPEEPCARRAVLPGRSGARVGALARRQVARNGGRRQHRPCLPARHERCEPDRARA